MDPIEIINQIIANAMATAGEYTENVDTAAGKIIRERIGLFYLTLL